MSNKPENPFDMPDLVVSVISGIFSLMHTLDFSIFLHAHMKVTGTDQTGQTDYHQSII